MAASRGDAVDDVSESLSIKMSGDSARTSSSLVHSGCVSVPDRDRMPPHMCGGCDGATLLWTLPRAVSLSRFATSDSLRLLEPSSNEGDDVAILNAGGSRESGL